MCPGAHHVTVWNVLHDDHTVWESVRGVITTQPNKHQRNPGIKSPVGLEENVDAFVGAERPGEHDVVARSRHERGPVGGGLKAVIGQERRDHLDRSSAARYEGPAGVRHRGAHGDVAVDATA
jgi:hypothetical protein